MRACSISTPNHCMSGLMAEMQNGNHVIWRKNLAFFRVIKNHLEFLIFAFVSIPDFVVRCQKKHGKLCLNKKNKKSACFCIKSRLLVLKSINKVLKPSIKSTLWMTQRPIKPNMICGFSPSWPIFSVTKMLANQTTSNRLDARKASSALTLNASRYMK